MRILLTFTRRAVGARSASGGFTGGSFNVSGGGLRNSGVGSGSCDGKTPDGSGGAWAQAGSATPKTSSNEMPVVHPARLPFPRRIAWTLVVSLVRFSDRTPNRMRIAPTANYAALPQAVQLIREQQTGREKRLSDTYRIGVRRAGRARH